MTFPHFGLYFGAAEHAAARQQRPKDADLQMAWAWLEAEPDTLVLEKAPTRNRRERIEVHKSSLPGLSAFVEAGFRYRFLDHEAAGEEAAAALQQRPFPQPGRLPDALLESAALLHAAELLRPLLLNSPWWTQLEPFLQTLLAQEPPGYVERVWQRLLSVTGGIVLENDSWLQQGMDAFRRIIDEDIRPDGYIRPAVERKEEERDGMSFWRMTLVTAALSLAAEAARQVGEDLWGYERRDVGINTAATYLVFYYFYPEKWRWDDGLTEETTHAIFTEYGAFIELVTAHAHPRGVELLLERERPFFSAAVGGLTSLSHFETQRHKKVGFFGLRRNS